MQTTANIIYNNIYHRHNTPGFRILQLKLQKRQLLFIQTTTYFSQLQRFLQQFYIWTMIFTRILFRKIVAVLVEVCKGLITALGYEDCTKQTNKHG